MDNKDICCIITGFGYMNDMAQNAFNSFKKFHPEIHTVILNDQDMIYLLDNYSSFEFKESNKIGIGNYLTNYLYATQNKYKRFIHLGADTITCDRVDELIYDDSVDAICTLDYPYSLEIGDFKTPIINGDHTHVNADVVCFNNLELLPKLIKFTVNNNTPYKEQGALNYYIHNHNCTYKILDHPYELTKYVYNARSKGNSCFSNLFQIKPHLNKFYIEDNKLYNEHNKQIKIYHYCNGFYNSEDSFNFSHKQINEWFPNDVKSFFKETCNCKHYF